MYINSYDLNDRKCVSVKRIALPAVKNSKNLIIELSVFEEPDHKEEKRDRAVRILLGQSNALADTKAKAKHFLKSILIKLVDSLTSVIKLLN